MSWNDTITRQGQDPPFDHVGPVADHIGDRPWTKFTSIDLAMPLADYAARDPYPIPTTRHREKYHADRHYDFWLSGLRDYLLITNRLATLGSPLKPGQAILDFGCASGRVLRHFDAQFPPDHDGGALDLWGVDICHSHIRWMLEHLSTSIRCFQSHAIPTLPIPDASIDLVYAFSVFSHIDEFELAWLCELRRVLKPGGIAYLTTHTDHTWSQLAHRTDWPLHKGMLRMAPHVTEHEISEAAFTQPLPEKRTVFRPAGITVYGKNVFHTTDYLHSVWGRFFTIEDIIREGAYYQDVVLLRRTDSLSTSQQVNKSTSQTES